MDACICLRVHIQACVCEHMCAVVSVLSAREKFGSPSSPDGEAFNSGEGRNNGAGRKKGGGGVSFLACYSFKISTFFFATKMDPRIICGVFKNCKKL